MARLQEAQDRLERALARLEAAAGKPRTSAGTSTADTLARELDETRRRCAALEAREREMSQRLDAAIGRLRAVLDG